MANDKAQEFTPNPQYGGQAVIEGVMMRSPRFFAVACRKPDGAIIVQKEPVEKSIVGRVQWLNKPFLRGTLALIDAMALGMKALNFAASVQAEAIDADKPALADPTAQEPASQEHKRSRINDIAIGSSMVFAMCVGLVLFVALPTSLTQLSQRWLNVHNQYALNMIDSLIRITIFLAYISLISMMDAIRRVFQFHGAEHKVINTFEAGGELTLDNCMKSSCIHPRCGTSFLVVVLIASMVVHSIFPRPPHALTRIALHISLIPVVAGLAYEVIKLAGKHRNSHLTRVLLAPGLWSQRLTTREPDREHVEVALASLNAVLNEEKVTA